MAIEILELIAIIGSISASIIGITKYEIKRLCKDIDNITKNQEEMQQNIKEIHEEVFHRKE
jgi:prefoldin subunit 5